MVADAAEQIFKVYLDNCNTRGRIVAPYIQFLPYTGKSTDKVNVAFNANFKGDLLLSIRVFATRKPVREEENVTVLGDATAAEYSTLGEDTNLLIDEYRRKHFRQLSRQQRNYD